ncbi:type VII secretion-associated serine protease mycosin [Streptomyces sp. NPDC059346]|uniref:type VII secretion-associated serine protease mycosin n=1 Tax=Streptomyces sp. NPDC059346 TaxID=3346807 RepID=UPI003694C0D5
MRISRLYAGQRFALTTVMGLVLTGVATAPAHAETAREQQWHLDAMHAEKMWRTSTGEGITVAVLDSGVDKNAVDLRGQVLDGIDYSEQKGDEHTDLVEHGTQMAALIAATGASGKDSGTYGLAPDAKILPIRLPYEWERGAGKEGGFTEKMALAIRFAADSDAKIINISMSGPMSNPKLTAAVNYALGKGKLIFAAVGNSGDLRNETRYPAATPGVVGVAGVDRHAKPYKDSQWGPQVDLAAPAVDVVSACPNSSQICGGDGTSMATALASASAALLWSQHPDWTNYQVLRVLLQTASGNDKGLSRDDVIGYGVVRPRIALTEPGDPGPADEYPLPDLAAKAPAPSKAAKDSAEPAAGPAASGDDDGDTATVGIAIGAGAAVLLGAGVAVWAVRRRRSRTP